MHVQVEDTLKEGQEKEEQQDQGNIKSEENAIEMSEDFDGQIHDGEPKETGILQKSITQVNFFAELKLLKDSRNVYSI